MSLKTPDLEDQIPVFKYPSDRVAHLYSQAPRSLFVASHDSLSYCGFILARLYTGRNLPNCPLLASHRR
jgi:hypothetical protein